MIGLYRIIVIVVIIGFLAAGIECGIIAWSDHQYISDLLIYVGGIATISMGFVIWKLKTWNINLFSKKVRDKIDNID